MKKYIWMLVVTLILFSKNIAGATQADDVTITISSQTAGPTPFIRRLNLLASQTSVLKSIRFEIKPKSGSVTRPLSATYSREYLTSRGYLNASTGTIVLPVYGLYAHFTNMVTLTYKFADGSSKQANATVPTGVFADPCGYGAATVLQPRTASTNLSYDYFLVKDSCSTQAPTILDTDGVVRWVGTAGVTGSLATFFDNAVYIANGSTLYRNELDGAVTTLGDYAGLGVTNFHHNIDRGKSGLLLEADTTSYAESTVIEVDPTGTVLKTWNLADIISQAMTTGGDDPNQFVFATPTDWFHNNAATYNRADDSLIVSSREDFIICIDYNTSAIKWILGDSGKKWFQFPSLRNFALTVPSGSITPIGQHAISITYDENLLLFDNGRNSLFQQPAGALRQYASPRKYRLNLQTKTATEVWHYPMDGSVNSPFCGSVYEDAPLNYLIDYAYITSPSTSDLFARLVGLDAARNKIFDYMYPTTDCDTAFNSIPLHLENTAFPAVEARPLNLSTRGTTGAGDRALIGGFILTGTDPKSIALRAIGPSLGSQNVSGAVADPKLMLFNSSGHAIAGNDNWQTDTSSSSVSANGLAPDSPVESALIRNLAPGRYTFVVRGKDTSDGIALVEAYDLSPNSNSKLANISSRGPVGVGDNVLIGGFIVGAVENTTIAVRAIGPSLTPLGVSDALADPTLTIYDTNGATIAHNDNWQEDISAADITANHLAPTNSAESSTLLHLPAGRYTAIVRGKNGSSGIALVEVYDLQ